MVLQSRLRRVAKKYFLGAGCTSNKTPDNFILRKSVKFSETGKIYFVHFFYGLFLGGIQKQAARGDRQSLYPQQSTPHQLFFNGPICLLWILFCPILGNISDIFKIAAASGYTKTFIGFSPSIYLNFISQLLFLIIQCVPNFFFFDKICPWTCHTETSVSSK